MEDASQQIRPPKRELGLNDDSMDQEPTAKNLKKEVEEQLMEMEEAIQLVLRNSVDMEEQMQSIVSTASATNDAIDGISNVVGVEKVKHLEKEVVNLSNELEEEREISREKVVEWQEKFEDARNAAREAEIRAERAETQLESKENLLVDATKKAYEQEMKMINMSNELEEEREKSRKNEIEWQEKFKGARNAAREAGIRAERAETLLDAKEILVNLLIDALKNAGGQEKIIDELTGNFSQFWYGNKKLQQAQQVPKLQPLQQPPQMQSQVLQPLPQPLPVAIKVPSAPVTVDNNAKFLAILEPCRTEMGIPIDEAVEMLRPLFKQCERKRHMLADFECEVCEKKKINSPILGHFFAKKHIKKVRASGAEVCTNAVEHWISELAYEPAHTARMKLIYRPSRKVMEERRAKLEKRKVAMKLGGAKLEREENAMKVCGANLEGEKDAMKVDGATRDEDEIVE